ncbi:hypothetical protein WMY93_019008 [Mugilogobius chulae]|uniref:Uncharacterized protein n=1 Tax=Mugilogobius chulae TaxID=88201 RepID=A0AAW0NCX2_9GOBI
MGAGEDSDRLQAKGPFGSSLTAHENTITSQGPRCVEGPMLSQRSRHSPHCPLRALLMTAPPPASAQICSLTEHTERESRLWRGSFQQSPTRASAPDEAAEASATGLSIYFARRSVFNALDAISHRTSSPLPSPHPSVQPTPLSSSLSPARSPLLTLSPARSPLLIPQSSPLLSPHPTVQPAPLSSSLSPARSPLLIPQSSPLPSPHPSVQPAPLSSSLSPARSPLLIPQSSPLPSPHPSVQPTPLSSSLSPARSPLLTPQSFPYPATLSSSLSPARSRLLIPQSSPLPSPHPSVQPAPLSSSLSPARSRLLIPQSFPYPAPLSSGKGTIQGLSPRSLFALAAFLSLSLSLSCPSLVLGRGGDICRMLSLLNLSKHVHPPGLLLPPPSLSMGLVLVLEFPSSSEEWSGGVVSVTEAWSGGVVSPADL